MTDTQDDNERILYCHCAYAKVVPPEVKREVLRRLGSSGRHFEAVPDLCEMSAKKDPAIRELSEGGRLRIAACYPRAVRWLFHAAGAPLKKDEYEVHNMRERTADEVVEGVLGTGHAEVS